MPQIITVRVIDWFDARIDILRRMNYADLLRRETMRDAFDDRNALYAIALYEGEMIGCIRISMWPSSPSHAWIENSPHVGGPQVVDFNRAVIARDFRARGLFSVLLAEAIIAAHRLGFRHAISAIDATDTMAGMLHRIGFANVGGVVSMRDEDFQSRVQPMEIPLAAGQAPAHTLFGRGVDKLYTAGYVVRSVVPTDVEAIAKSRAKVANAEQVSSSTHSTDVRPTIAPPVPSAQVLQLASNPFPPEPMRWRDSRAGRFALDCVAICAVSCALFAPIEIGLLGFSIETTLAMRGIFCVLVVAGLWNLVQRVRGHAGRVRSSDREPTLSRAQRVRYVVSAVALVAGFCVLLHVAFGLPPRSLVTSVAGSICGALLFIVIADPVIEFCRRVFGLRIRSKLRAKTPSSAAQRGMPTHDQQTVMSVIQ